MLASAFIISGPAIDDVGQRGQDDISGEKVGKTCSAPELGITFEGGLTHVKVAALAQRAYNQGVLHPLTVPSRLHTVHHQESRRAVAGLVKHRMEVGCRHRCGMR